MRTDTVMAECACGMVVVKSPALHDSPLVDDCHTRAMLGGFQRERERDAPPFLTLAAVFSFSPLSLSQQPTGAGVGDAGGRRRGRRR